MSIIICDSQKVQNCDISNVQKLRRVTELIQELQADLKEINFLPSERNAAIEELKIYAREPEISGPIYTAEGIEILIQHSFHSPSPTTSNAALQALANALLSGPQTRQIFVDSGYSSRAVARLKNPKKDDELLMSRILFLTSYDTTQSFTTLIENHHLAEHINDNLARHAKHLAKQKKPDPLDDKALIETLKLLYNITHFCPSQVDKFQRSVGHIIKIISLRTPCKEAPVHPPVNNLINSLQCLNLEEKKTFPNKAELRHAIEKLSLILELSLTLYTSEAQLESALIPLLKLLKRLASAVAADVKQHMKDLLLPPTDLVYSTLTSDSPLSYRLLGHMRAPITTQLYDSISGLFFSLSDQNAEDLTSSFGISFASGFLLSRNGQMPSIPSYSSSIRSSLTGPTTWSDGRDSRSSIPSRTEELSDMTSPTIMSPVEEILPHLRLSTELMSFPLPLFSDAVGPSVSVAKLAQSCAMGRTASAPETPVCFSRPITPLQQPVEPGVHETPPIPSSCYAQAFQLRRANAQSAVSFEKSKSVTSRPSLTNLQVPRPFFLSPPSRPPTSGLPALPRSAPTNQAAPTCEIASSASQTHITESRQAVPATCEKSSHDLLLPTGIRAEHGFFARSRTAPAALPTLNRLMRRSPLAAMKTEQKSRQSEHVGKAYGVEGAGNDILYGAVPY